MTCSLSAPLNPNLVCCVCHGHPLLSGASRRQRQQAAQNKCTVTHVELRVCRKRWLRSLDVRHAETELGLKWAQNRTVPHVEHISWGSSGT